MNLKAKKHIYYMLLDFIFLMILVSAGYGVFMLLKICCPFVNTDRQLTLPSINNVNNVDYEPVLPPIIVRCGMYETINKSENTSHESCAICIEKYDINSQIAILEKCNHMFHEGCVTEWFKKSYICPMCNT